MFYQISFYLFINIFKKCEIMIEITTPYKSTAFHEYCKKIAADGFCCVYSFCLSFVVVYVWIVRQFGLF